METDVLYFISRKFGGTLLINYKVHFKLHIWDNTL